MTSCVVGDTDFISILGVGYGYVKVVKHHNHIGLQGY